MKSIITAKSQWIVTLCCLSGQRLNIEPASVLSQFPCTAFSVHIVFDPEKDGNCQFSAICHQLELKGVAIISSLDLRQKTVHYLMTNPLPDGDVLALDNGLQCSWKSYLSKLSVDGTYGDNVTLLAICRMYNVQILVLSSASLAHTRLISTDDCLIPEKPLLVLGHYPEGRGEHYVSLSCENFSDPLTVSQLLSTPTQLTAASLETSSNFTLANSSPMSSDCTTMTKQTSSSSSALTCSTATFMPDSSQQLSTDTFDLTYASASDTDTVPADVDKEKPSQPVLQNYPVTKLGKVNRKFQASW